MGKMVRDSRLPSMDLVIPNSQSNAFGLDVRPAESNLRLATAASALSDRAAGIDPLMADCTSSMLKP